MIKSQAKVTPTGLARIRIRMENPIRMMRSVTRTRKGIQEYAVIDAGAGSGVRHSRFSSMMRSRLRQNAQQSLLRISMIVQEFCRTMRVVRQIPFGSGNE
jgi:hypothetical protein